MKTKKKLVKYRWRMYLVVGLAGLIVVSFLLYSFDIGLRMTVKYSQLLDATHNINIEVTTAHLLFEEILIGDKQEDIEAMWKHIDQADWYAEAMLEGGVNTAVTIFPLNDYEMRREVTILRDKLTELKSITRERINQKESAIAGTNIDQLYDKIFKNCVNQVDKVENRLQRLIVADLGHYRTTKITIIITVILLTLIVVIVLDRYEKLRQVNINKIEYVNRSLLEEIAERKLVEEEVQKISDIEKTRVKELQISFIKLQQSQDAALNLMEDLSGEIEERKKTEEALRESESSLKEAQRIANMGSWIWNLKTNDVAWSDNLCLMHGMKPGEFDGQFDTAMSLIHPDDLESVRKKIQQLMDGKKAIEFDYRIIARNGVVKVVRGYQQLTFDDEGNIVRMVGILQDITERKQAEMEIRKLSHSVEQSPAIVIITDTSGNIEYVNSKFEEVTGYTVNEVIGKNTRILKAGEKTIEEYEILWKTIKAGGVWKGEFHNRKKNGELYWEFASISGIKDPRGEITHFVAIKENITERKAMEKILRESHNRLRSLAERLQMIREEERATIAREIHDDLGQSLTALKMDISWMKNSPEMDAETREVKFDTMLDLTNDTIQTVKRIATELRPGILDDLGLVPAIEWLAAEFQSRYKIQCNVSINKSDVIIKDETSIAVFRIFQETLTNVARHSGAAKVNIGLNFHDDNKLIMEIADNGVGIDEEQINSSKSLGLFGIRERVNILNGEMEIIGEHGKGTKVRVSIPISKEEVENNKYKESDVSE